MYFKGKTVFFENPIPIVGSAGVVGKKEGEGPLADDFDAIYEDTSMAEDSFELAESAMLNNAVTMALSNANCTASQVDFVMAGDLLNQCTGSCFALKDLEIPTIGMYGACSTMALTLANACMLINAGANCCVVGASSHFCSSERQFRFPLEYGGQRPPTAQWTVTGAGAAVVAKPSKDNNSFPHVCAIHIGKITDLGITDANNMGAAMAPAAARTIADFLNDTNSKPQDYDLILTGDLGFTGSSLLYQLLEKEYALNIQNVHNDCGLMIYNLKEQDVNSGGSGCGCSGSVVCSHILKQMNNKKLNNVLFVATGALMSTTSSKQGQPIPGIAHAVHIKS